MPLLNEETLLKIKSLPPDIQQRVLDGIAKLLSVRAGSHVDELHGNGQLDGES